MTKTKNTNKKRTKRGQANKHGLSRKIPADIRRQVRASSRFGCVICGALFCEYAHIDPPYSEAIEHKAECIALLCKKHHGEFDCRPRLLAIDQVIAAMAKPFNCDNQPWLKMQFQSRPVVLFGGQALFGEEIRVQVNGNLLLGIRPPEQDGGPWRLSGQLYGRDGLGIVRFHDNELRAIGGTDTDVRFEKGEVVVSYGPRKTVLRMIFDLDRKTIEVAELETVLGGGHLLTANATSVKITGPVRNAHFSFDELYGENTFGPGAQFAPFRFDNATAYVGCMFTSDDPKRPTVVRLDAPELGNPTEWRKGVVGTPVSPPTGWITFKHLRLMT